MKDGYYWAKGLRDDQPWEIVEVWTYGGDKGVSMMDSLDTFELEEFEFGDKIEIPEKYA